MSKSVTYVPLADKKDYKNRKEFVCLMYRTIAEKFYLTMAEGAPETRKCHDTNGLHAVFVTWNNKEVGHITLAKRQKHKRFFIPADATC